MRASMQVLEEIVGTVQMGIHSSVLLYSIYRVQNCGRRSSLTMSSIKYKKVGE
jgi:hypothetical protein